MSSKKNSSSEIADTGFRDATILSQAVQIVDANARDRQSHWFHDICKKGQ
ncbi:MAG: hypothetical protein O7C75_05840 [Verrucomicrobia bacterium]|nr:hypothetical protein [Verrucomicrobiota bacterium]